MKSDLKQSSGYCKSDKNSILIHFWHKLTSGSSNSSTSNPPSCGSDCCNIDGVLYTRDQVTKCDTASCTVGR